MAGEQPVAAVEALVDETLKEVIFSLDASYVEKIPLDRYALFALDALADLDPCLSRTAGPGSLILRCNERSLTVPWPPQKAIDVATLTCPGSDRAWSCAASGARVRDGG